MANLLSVFFRQGFFGILLSYKLYLVTYHTISALVEALFFSLSRELQTHMILCTSECLSKNTGTVLHSLVCILQFTLYSVQYIAIGWNETLMNINEASTNL